MPYSYRDMARRLRKLGYKIVREGKGSHVIFSNGQVTFPLPKHSGSDISMGVEKKILKLIGLTARQFREL